MQRRSRGAWAQPHVLQGDPRLWEGQGCPGSVPALHVDSDRPGSQTWVHLLAVTLTHLGLPRTTWAGEPSAWCPAHSRCSLNGGAAPRFGDQHRLVAASPLLVSLHRFVRADFRSPAWPSRRPPCVCLAEHPCTALPLNLPSFLSAVNPWSAA